MIKQRLIFALAIFLVASFLAFKPSRGLAQQDDNPRPAQLGENRGQIPEGNREIWTYEGQAGEVLTIKASADNPANDANPEERRQAGLLDMMLIVYTPDNTIIAKADDIQPGTVTDSVIEGLQLPTDGTYKIKVLGLEKQGSGAYTLTLQAGNATPADPTPTINPDWPILTIENQLEDTICYVYIWPISAEEFGDEWLDTKKVISPNDEHKWHVPPNEYNIAVSDCYGNTLDFRQQFNVTQPSTLTISPLDGPAAQCADGSKFIDKNKADEALPLLEAGFAGRESATFANPDDKGRCALVLGLLRSNIGNPFGALEALQVALDIFRVSGNRELKGATLGNIGLVYHAQGKYEQAFKSFQQALDILRKAGDRVGESAALDSIGAVYHAQGKYKQAFELYQRALDISREVGDRVGESTALGNIGMVYHAQGKYEQALELHNETLEIRREVGDRTSEGVTLNNIGVTYHVQGKYDQALVYYEQALKIRREVGHRTGEGVTLNNIGVTYHAQGKYNQALKSHQQALDISREVGDRVGESGTLNNIGGIYHAQGKYEQALESYKQSLYIKHEVGNRAGEGITLNNIGGIYHALGKYEQAIESYKQALEIRREVGDRVGEGTTLSNIGTVYDNQEKYEQALAYLQQALEIRREVGDRTNEGSTLGNIGMVYYNQEKYDQALAYCKLSIEINREVGDRVGEGRTLNNIGVVYDNQGKYSQALKSYQQALDILREVGDQAGKGSTLNNIGAVYKQQGQPEEALDYYEQAMDLFNAVRATAGDDGERASFITQYAGLYNDAIGLYHQQGQDEEAFYTSERGRARSFLDSLATGYVQLSDDDLQELLTREREAYAQRFAAQDALARTRGQNPPDAELVADLEAQLEAAEEAYSKVEAEIEARGGQLEELIPGRSTVLKLSEVQQLLDEQTTLVSYWLLGDDGTLAFIITQDSSLVIELPEATPDKLQSTLSALYGWPNLENRSPETLTQLHEWLIAPLQEHLRTPQVGIIPHQLLHYVPFAALTDGEGYFGEQHTLFVLPSASALQPLQETVAKTSQADKQPALVFGNPTTREELELDPLGGAADEARAVAELLGVPLYTKDEASEERLWSEANNAYVVHLSAHGVYATTNSLDNSAIFLAASDGGGTPIHGESRSDGSFTVREVYQLDLSATELVVLSACETTINDLSARDEVAVSAGDEVVGLTRAFLFAGTPTVVASLWPVDDKSTKELMVSFYRHWQEEGMSKGEALQAAQAEIRQKYPSPYYWAGFVLSGEPSESTAPEKGTWTWLFIGSLLLVVAGLAAFGWHLRRTRQPVIPANEYF